MAESRFTLNDPFSLLPEEEKEKLAQEALGLVEKEPEVVQPKLTEEEFVNDFAEANEARARYYAPQSFLGQIATGLVSGIKNIPSTLSQSIIDNEFKSIEQEFLTETGEIAPPKPLGFGTTFGEGAAGRLFVPQETKFIQDYQQEKKDTFNALPQVEKINYVNKYLNALDENFDAWQAQQKIIEKNTQGLGKTARAVSGGVTSFGIQASGLALTLATKNPTFMYGMLPVFGYMERGSSYREARMSGLSHRDAMRVSGMNALFEVGTELIPLPFVSKTMKKYWKDNGSTLQQFARDGATTALVNIGSENANTILQETNKAIGGVQTELAVAWANKDNPEYDGPEWWEVMADNAYMTTVSALVSSGGMVSAQGVAAFGPDIQKNVLNTFDKNPARQIARELNLMVNRSEAQFKALDDTYQYVFKSGLLSPSRSIMALETPEEGPKDFYNMSPEQFLTPSRQAYYLRNPEILPDEYFAERILARDIVSEELNEAEKTLIREYASEFATEDFDPIESVEQVRKVMNIMQEDNIIDLPSFDQRVQERIVQYNNQIEAAKVKANNQKLSDEQRESANELLNKLETDRQTLNNYINKNVPKAQQPSLERKEYDTDYNGNPYVDNDRSLSDHLPHIEAIQKNLELVEDQIKQESDPRDIERVQNEILRPLQFNRENFKFSYFSTFEDGKLVDILPGPRELEVGPGLTDVGGSLEVGDTRDFTEQESVAVAEIIDNLIKQGMPEQVFKIMPFLGVVGTETTETSPLGEYRPESGIVLVGNQTIINSSIFQERIDPTVDIENLEQNDKDFINAAKADLQFTLAHEIAHSIDYIASKRGDIDNRRSFAATSPLFETIDINAEFSKIAEDNGLDPELSISEVMRRLDIDKVLMHKFTTGGQIFKELFNLYLVSRTGPAQSPLGGKILSYPFNRYLADIDMGKTGNQEFVKSELFAQAYGLYYTNRRTLGKYAPRTLKLIEDINNATTDNKFATIGLRIRDAFQSDRSDADSQIYRRRSAGRDIAELFGPESTYRRVERVAERPEVSVPVPEQDIAESNYVPIGQLKLTETTQTFAGSPKNEDGSFRNTQKDFNKLAKDLVKLAENPLSLLEQSRDWYKNVNVEIDNLTRGNPKLKEDVLRMLTIYSSQTPVETNLAYTLRSLVSLAKNGDPLPGFQPEAGEYAAAALAAQDFGQKLPGVGFKLQSFYENLTGKNPNAVTMDTWMFRLLGFQENQNALANHRYGTAVIQEATNLYNKKHNDNLTPMEMQAVLWTYARNKDLQAKGKPAEYVGYETFIDKASATVTTEVIPTQTLPEFAFGEKLNPKAKAIMTRELLEAITTAEGKNMIMELFPGTGLYKFSHSFGAYDGKINPNIVTSLLLEKVQGEQQFSNVDLSYADDFLRAWGYVFRQDAVPYFVANESITEQEINDMANEAVNSGSEITFVDKQTGAPIDLNDVLRKQLNEALRKQGIDGFTQLSANEIGIINFKFNGQVVENFNEKINAALESVGLEGAKADIRHNIRYNTQYLTNNWQENPDGNQYLKGRLESKSVQQRLVRIRAKVDAIFDRYRAGDYETGVDGAFPTTGQGGPRLRREPSPLPEDQQLAIEESLDNLPPSPPPPPGGPDPDGNFSLREMSFFQTEMEKFNITVANRFGRLWTIEENLIDQFGERDILKRIEELGIDPNSKDWRVTTQTDIFSGRIKDLLRDIREDYFEPMVDFLQSKGINEAEYNHFIYNLHAPERNAYLPTKFTEDLNKAELELAALEKSRLSTKQELANARRKVTTLKNKIKKAEKGSGISTAQAVATLKKYGVIFDLQTMEARGSLTKGKNLLEAFNRYHKPMMDFTRKIMIDSGLEAEQAVREWDARYKYYVPLQGFAEDTLIDPKTGREITRKQSRSDLINSQMTVAGSLIREAKGRESIAAAPLQQSVVQASSAAVQAEKNRVIKSLADLARAFPSKMYSVSEDVGDLVVDSKWDESKGYSRVGFREDGQQKYVEIYDRLLAKGFDNFDTSVSGNFMKLMRFGTRWLSMVNTSLDPTFMINNFLRDVQTGWYNLLAEQEIEGGRARGLEIAKKYYTSVNILNNAKELIRFENNRALNLPLDLAKEIRNLEASEFTAEKIDELQRKYSAYSFSIKNQATPSKIKMQMMLSMFKRYGGETGYIESRTVDKLTDELQDMMDMYQGTFKGNVKKGRDTIFKFIERYNMGIENAARFTAFQGYVELNGGLENATPAIFERAAALSKNLTVNFNRMGTMGPTVNAMYMFFNASIQGTVNTFRGVNPLDKNFYASRKGKALGGLMGIASLAAMYNLLTADEDDDGRNMYHKISDWEKQTKFIFMLPGVDVDGKGELIVEPWGAGSKYLTIDRNGKKKEIGASIPMPYGYAFFANVARIATELILAKDLDNYDYDVSDAAKEFAHSALHNFSPLPYSTEGEFFESIGVTALPSVFKPFGELAINRDHFGSPIYYEPFFNDTTPKSYRENKKIPEFIKGLVRTINDVSGGNEFYAGKYDIDPAPFIYLFDQGAGGLGRTVRRTYNFAFNPDRPPTNQIPVFRRVTTTTNDRMDMEYFYDNAAEVQRAENAYRDLMESLDPSEDPEEFLDRINFPLESLGNTLNAYATRRYGNNSLLAVTEKRLKEVRDQQQAAREEYYEKDRNKYHEIYDELEEEEIEIMKEFNKVYRESVQKGR